MQNELTAIGDDTLRELAAINEANLPHTCTVTRSARTGGGPGGESAADDDTPVLPAGTPCRLTPQNRLPTDAVTMGQLASQGRWLLTLRVGTVIPPQSDAVVEGAHPDGTPWSRPVRVLLGLRTTKAFATLARYVCEDVTPAGR